MPGKGFQGRERDDNPLGEKDRPTAESETADREGRGMALTRGRVLTPRRRARTNGEGGILKGLRT